MTGGYLNASDSRSAIGANINAAIPEDNISFDTVVGHDHNGVNSKTLSALSGLTKITVGTTEPTSPATGDLWVDCN